VFVGFFLFLGFLLLHFFVPRVFLWFWVVVLGGKVL
jgi:uncharacterized BrkB/YihY/UPF0761 family membrane protein